MRKPPPVSREKMERARDSAMLHALFYWQLEDRTTNLKVRNRWAKLGDEKAVGVLRLERELKGKGWDSHGE